MATSAMNCQKPRRGLAWDVTVVPMTSLVGHAVSTSDRESGARYYAGVYPANFVAARGSRVWDQDGNEFIDFFCGAGALNLGHNDPRLKGVLLDYLAGDGLTHALDLETPAREAFRGAVDRLLRRHDLNFRFLSPGPTGANAVEAALKIARRATGRSGVLAFTGAFHGMTLGALGVTSSRFARVGAGTALHDVTFIPYPGADTPWSEHSLDYLVDVLDDTHSGVALPAAIIIESVQAEGGVNPAPLEWLRGLAQVCAERDILLISDDIQVGCGRTGDFFSMDAAGVTPDIVVMAKGVSGLGQPISLVLYRHDLDVLEPGQHNGTFRGNQLAFVTAAANLDLLDDPQLRAGVLTRSEYLTCSLAGQLSRLGVDAPVRGRGLIIGVDLRAFGRDLGSRVVQGCLKRGVIVEAAGRHDTVVKMLPPFNVDVADIDRAVTAFGAALESELATSAASGF